MGRYCMTVLAVTCIACGTARGSVEEKVYWGRRLYGEIFRANLDGSGAEAIVGPSVYTNDIALDVSGGKMYWTDYSSNLLQRANLDGSGIETLKDFGGGSDVTLHGIAVDPVHEKVYWGRRLYGEIFRANLDGSGAEAIVGPSPSSAVRVK